jgi:hypothetical protein
MITPPMMINIKMINSRKTTTKVILGDTLRINKCNKIVTTKINRIGKLIDPKDKMGTTKIKVMTTMISKRDLKEFVVINMLNSNIRIIMRGLIEMMNKTMMIMIDLSVISASKSTKEEVKVSTSIVTTLRIEKRNNLVFTTGPNTMSRMPLTKFGAITMMMTNKRWILTTQEDRGTPLKDLTLVEELETVKATRRERLSSFARSTLPANRISKKMMTLISTIAPMMNNVNIKILTNSPRRKIVLLRERLNVNRKTTRSNQMTTIMRTA